MLKNCRISKGCELEFLILIGTIKSEKLGGGRMADEAVTAEMQPEFFRLTGWMSLLSLAVLKATLAHCG